jgi:hypothetical protein
MDNLDENKIYLKGKRGEEDVKFLAILNEDGILAKKEGLIIERHHIDCLIDITNIERFDFS